MNEHHDHEHACLSERRASAGGSATTPATRSRGSDLAWERIRAKLSGQTGPRYWRSIEELADTTEFQEMLHREFPNNASEWLDPIGRRSFLKLMGASLGLAGLAACTRQPAEKIVPYVKSPEEITPGNPLYYATAFPFNGYGTGVLVESHEGRPTKIEGNELHPASLGASDVFMQASILDLYDPDRSKVLTHGGQIESWERFRADLQDDAKRWRELQGAGVRILTPTITSPALTDHIEEFIKLLPQARWHQYDSINRDNERRGAELAFGRPVDTRYVFKNARVILALDSDFLQGEPGSVRYAREFADARRALSGSTEMNRLYVVEPTPTITGAMADHRLRIRRSQIESLTRTLARSMSILSEGPEPLPAHVKWVEAVLADLKANRGASLVIAGRSQPPIVHALAQAMNEALGNVGKTVIHTDPVEPRPVHQLEELRQLADALSAGRVDTLIVLGGNPVYTAPSDLKFDEAMKQARLVIRLGLYEDESSSYAHWHVPAAHYLESWGDIRAFDGTISILQPLIEPLYDGKTPHDLLSMLIGALGGPTLGSSYEIVRDYWRRQQPGIDFENFWRRALHDGVIADTALPAIAVSAQTARINASATTKPQEPTAAQPSPAVGTANVEEVELVFNPDPTIWDGTFANNGWLQECPKPLTHLTWDNAFLISPGTAEKLRISNQDEIRVALEGRRLDGPAFILPGQPDDVVTLHLGYGRSRTGRIGLDIGVNAGELRTLSDFWLVAKVRVTTTGETRSLAPTHGHHNMEGREIVRSATLEQFKKDPTFAQDKEQLLSLLPNWKDETYAWGMAINQNVCIGCNACVVACQAENNIPVVGKEQVIAQREMHWLRIDTYFKGDPADPQETLFQPMACQHCEKAPCELVCPVGATVHSAEGLNQMVYNRCVGTRYCSNNCPYKVRRFNFLYYTEAVSHTPTLKMLQNPDVTVRTRGVMEKCTYCIQRITSARISAEKEERQIRDGEIVTACQQSCPTQAIVFGDIKDADSAVSKLKHEPLNYGVLTELNTQPRTTYLAKLTNPNEELEQHKEARA
jgi:MoCo/4Fe-4S cofactor protein with predicted Tat translocation signal